LAQIKTYDKAKKPQKTIAEQKKDSL